MTKQYKAKRETYKYRIVRTKLSRKDKERIHLYIDEEDMVATDMELLIF